MFAMSQIRCVFCRLVAAVYFEQGEFDKCIEEAQEAVTVGREHRADYKHIAK